MERFALLALQWLERFALLALLGLTWPLLVARGVLLVWWLVLWPLAFAVRVRVDGSGVWGVGAQRSGSAR